MFFASIAILYFANKAVHSVYEKCQSIDYIFLIFDCQIKMKCFAMNNDVNKH